ncbi:MAG: hypothetical protein P4L53_20680 [Candidatus Obscuribacterales bacterium]|nr:hypothetical protein [Candidatus Obscuribacterales bacterium]
MQTRIEPTLKDLASLLELEQAAKQGDILSPESAEIIEKALKVNELDLINRARLLGFYKRWTTRRRTQKTAQFEKRRVKNILWFIAHLPGCTFCSDDYFSIKNSEAFGYSEVAAAWRAAIKQNHDDSQVLINAALFFLSHEPDMASTLIQRVLKTDEQNQWAISILNELEPSTVSKATEIYDLNEFSLHPPTKATLKLLGDRQSTFIDNSFRCKLSAISARTLTRLLEKYPSDVNARAGLTAYYGANCELQNKFGVNPEFERQFVSHLAWFIKFALGAEGLDSVRIPELSIKGRNTLLQLLKLHNSNTLNKVAIKNKKYLQEKLRVKTEADKIMHLRFLEKWGRMANKPGILDAIALKCDKPKLRDFPLTKKYTLTEWANDSYLAKGGLTGSYRWFAKDFALRLDEVMEIDSADLYHRALIIGSYHCDETRANSPQLKAAFEKHMHWLIANCPGSRYLRDHWWDDVEKVDFELKAKLTSSWLKKIKSSDDPKVLVNACLAHFSNDRAIAKKIIEKALKIAPRDSMAVALAARLEERSKLLTPEVRLKKLGFKHGCASSRLTKFSERFDTSVSELFGVDLPERTIWTLEQVLHNNANDLGARAEIMGFFFNHQYCNAIAGRDPATSAEHLAHELWWIQNIPAMPKRRVFRACQSEEESGCFTIAAAWNMQLNSYPHKPEVALNASRVFFLDSGGYEYGIDVLKAAVKLNPGNSKLKKRLQELRKNNRRLRA